MTRRGFRGALRLARRRDREHHRARCLHEHTTCFDIMRDLGVCHACGMRGTYLFFFDRMPPHWTKQKKWRVRHRWLDSLDPRTPG